MTTWEARELASWLRGLGSADPKTITATDPAVVRFWMTEPNLMFTLAATSMGIVTLDVYFDAESRPPSGSNDDKAGLGHRVRLTIPQADLAVAVGDWERDLIAFPVR